MHDDKVRTANPLDLAEAAKKTVEHFKREAIARRERASRAEIDAARPADPPEA